MVSRRSQKEAQIWKKEIYEESGGIMGLLKGKGEEGGTWKANFSRPCYIDDCH